MMSPHPVKWYTPRSRDKKFNPMTPFEPPPLLRNAHTQTIINSIKLRRPLIHHRASGMLNVATSHILDCGAGVRLMGLYSPKEKNPCDLCILIHGWEGDAASSYLESAAGYLWNLGFSVFRLNLRDHGPTHHLNPALFHACRIQEVVGAIKRIQDLFPHRRLLLGGFSLGGNFALRVGLHAKRAGIHLDRITAVCPVLNPDHTITALETGFPLYHWHFMRKWQRSLRKKHYYFPELVDLVEISQFKSIRALTDYFVPRYTEYPDATAYLYGYAVVGNRLADLQIPSTIIISQDDPVIPVADLNDLARPGCLFIEKQPYGGHCGFIKDMALNSWANQRLGELFSAG